EQPRALQSEDAAFLEESTARLAVNGMYDPLGWGESAQLLNGHSYEFHFGDICSDDCEKGSTFADYADLQQLKEFTTNGTSSTVGALWAKYWVAIFRANTVLRNLPDSPLSDRIKDEFEGEARFVRAFSYFTLVKIFGGVPLLEDPVSPADINARNFDRASIGEIYALIDSDLAFAVDHLPAKNSASPGRANRGAAAAYLARAYMYQIGTDNTNNHSWDEVLDITNRFINGEYGSYALASNYATIFEEEGENNIESIFEIQAVDNGVDPFARGDFIGAEWTIFRNPQFMGGWGFSTPTADLANAFEFNDPRRPATTIAIGEYAYGVEMAVSERNQTGYYARKAIVNPELWITDKGSGQNIRKFRYADILLMNAEAAYHTGNATQAVQRLMEIRDRASSSTFPKGFDPNDPGGYMATGYAPLDNSIIPTAGQALLDFIYLERRREFGIEQLRFWDLVRTGRYIDQIRSTYQNLQNPDDGNFADRVADAALDRSITTGVINPIPLFPIPALDLDNWGIEQNPGY
ncbi:MAG: RagB/SusD family nutrient uptake outer membrane protein, partial [Bacteroidota bacterium]